MDTFRRLVVAAALAGSIAGIFVTLLHQVTTVPVILSAEIYERAAAAQRPASAMAAMPVDAQEHEHGATSWEPADGLERAAFTALADVLTGIGFALVLVAIYALWGRAVDWRKGLYFGLAGFAAVSLAPSLGLPPEVPGTAAGPLAARQIWWVLTALLTSGGLALLFLGRKPILMLAGVALIVFPHAYGAPQAAQYASAAPEAIAHRFVVAVMITSLLFWAALGALTGLFYDRVLARA
jgi:cobalt transporter subunit CbtA